MIVAPATSRRSRGLVPLDDGTVYVLRYLRVSSQEQADKGLSLDVQDSETIRYTLGYQDDGWIEDGVYRDVLSGRKPERHGYQALLTRARELRAQRKRVVIVVFKTDRFGRRLSERIRAWEEFKDLSIELHSVYEGGKQDRLNHNIRAILSEEEVEALSQRVISARAYVIERGWQPIGRPAWGYRWRAATDPERAQGAPTKVLDIDEDEADHVREAWRMRADDGASIHKVAGWIATLSDEARGGRTFDYSMTRQMFAAPVYVARPTTVYERGQPLPAPPVLDRPRGRWPALVDDDTWQRVAAQNETGRRLPPQASGKYLLTGLLRCWVCGHRMDARTFLQPSGRKRGKEWRTFTYRCISGKRGALGATVRCLAEGPGAVLDELVRTRIGRLIDAVSAPDFLIQLEAAKARVVERDAREIHKAQADLAAEVARANKARKSIADAAQGRLDGIIGEEDYLILRAERLADLHAAEARIAELRAWQPSAPLPALAGLLALAPTWAEAFKATANVAATRAALGQLVDCVVPTPSGRKWQRTWDVEIMLTPLGQVLADAVQDDDVGHLALPN